jgi:uncharacterized protein (TIGR03435 family)
MIYRFTTLVFIGLAAFAAPNPPAFDVASIKPNQMGNTGGEKSERENITVSPEGVIMRNVSLRSCLKWAYDVKDFQINGPGWLASQKYDIAAKTATPTSNDQLRLMMQTLLADRFKLVLHRATKDLPVFALVVGKNGPKFHESPAGDVKSSMRPSGGSLEFRNFTMTEFAEQLSARPLKVDRPVLDKTDLNGPFDFTMKLADNTLELKHTLEGIEKGDGQSISTIIQQELGLKLQPQKGPVEILVIDGAEKTPSEN